MATRVVYSLLSMATDPMRVFPVPWLMYKRLCAVPALFSPGHQAYVSRVAASPAVEGSFLEQGPPCAILLGTRHRCSPPGKTGCTVAWTHGEGSRHLWGYISGRYTRSGGADGIFGDAKAFDPVALEPRVHKTCVLLCYAVLCVAEDCINLHYSFMKARAGWPWWFSVCSDPVLVRDGGTSRQGGPCKRLGAPVRISGPESGELLVTCNTRLRQVDCRSTPEARITCA